jgi:hypothetical protein
MTEKLLSMAKNLQTNKRRDVTTILIRLNIFKNLLHFFIKKKIRL